MMMDPSAMKQVVVQGVMVAEQNWASTVRRTVAQQVVQKNSSAEVELVALLHYFLVLGIDVGAELQTCWAQSF